MFIPSAKSKFSLILLLIVSIVLFIWVNNSRIFVKQKYFSEKLEAAKLMKKAGEVIKEYRLEQGVFIDEINDPNKTSLIGEKQTLITTDRGNLTAKLTSLNPNLAAVVIEMFKKTRLKKGDVIAMSCTGSFPAVNLAVMSAAKVMELNMIIISSVGASMFGATDPDFTWLDMEKLLNEKGIFNYKSIAASIGGGRDLGRGLNQTGRELIIESIKRNEVQLVQENSLENNIKKKMGIFKESAEKPVKLYVNIGGGLSSLGNSISGKLLSPGLRRHVDVKNIPLKGTLFLFAEEGIPIVHLLDIIKVAEIYNLPIAPDPIPEPGIGTVFLAEKYNITISGISLVILVLLILVIIFFDHKQMKLKEDEVNISQGNNT